MSEFEEARAKREGKITPHQLTNNLAEACKEDDIEFVIYVTREKSGIVNVGWSAGNTTEAIGLLEVAKQDIIDSMRT